MYLLLDSFRPEEVQALISGKLALRYAGRQASTSCHWIFIQTRKESQMLQTTF